MNYTDHIKEINRVKEELKHTLSPKRRHDLKKHLGRLHKELAEAKKWEAMRETRDH